jgi:MFS family permease
MAFPARSMAGRSRDAMRGGPGMGGMAGMGSSRPSLRNAFVALRNRDFRILFLSMVAANAAMGMQMLARGWLAFQLTGSFAIVGVISISFGIPMLLLSLVGGATADRMDKRSLMVITQIGTGLLTLLTAVLITTGIINVPILFALGLAQGTIMAFRMPVQLSMLAEIVPEHELMSAMAINNAAMSATRPLAPVAAGLLLAAFGVDAVYYAQAVMYGVTLLFVLQLPKSTTHLERAEERGGLFAEIGIGVRYIAGERTLLMLLLMGVVPMMLLLPPMMTLLPGFAIEELGLSGDGLGFLMAVGGIGALAGSFVVATLTEFPRKPLLQMVAGLGAGAGLVALGMGTKAFGYEGALAGLIMLGLFQTVFMTLNMTMVMTQTQPEFYGRVMSVFMLLFSVMPFMAYPMGVLADRITASTTFGLAGLVVVGFMALMFAINPRYVLSRIPAVARGGDGQSLSGAAWSALSSGGSGGGSGGGFGGGFPGGMSRGRARAATAMRPGDAAAPPASPAAQPAAAAQATRVVAASNGDSASAAVPVAAPAVRASAPPAPANYMGGAERPQGRDYMADGDEIAPHGDGSAQQRRQPGWLTGYGLIADATSGASAAAWRSYGFEASPGGASDDGATRAEPAAVGDAPAPPTNEPTRPSPGREPAAYVLPGVEATVEQQHSTPDPGPAERVNIPAPPPRGRAGMLERSLIAAVTATVVTRALSSLLRSPSGRR